MIALGKIGLPLAVQISGKGHEVMGADVSPKVVEMVSRAEPPFPGEAELSERLEDAISNHGFTAVTDTRRAVGASEVVVVVVPLMTDENGTPDFTAMDAATEDIAAALQPGTLVSYETTLAGWHHPNEVWACTRVGFGFEARRGLLSRSLARTGIQRADLLGFEAVPEVGWWN